MDIKQCKHIRIRDKNCYDLNVKEYIESLEKQYNIDFRSLPQWKELIKRLHVMNTDCKRKIQDAHLRKTLIVQKLFTQFRPSPFELSDNMVRTAKKWEALKIKENNKQIPSTIKNSELTKPSTIIEPKTEISITSINMLESSEVKFEELNETAHRNSEIYNSQLKMLSRRSKVHEQSIIDTISFLPPKVYNNIHKRVPSTESLGKYTQLSYGHDIQFAPKSEPEQILLPHTSSVISTPKEILIIFDHLREQTITFSVTNCTSDFMHIRFKQVTNKTPFKRVKILPVTPLRLYPGIAVVYKLVFKLVERKKEFTSELFFTLGRDVYDNAPNEAFRIPIASKFIKARNVSVSEVVTIPPLYVWHMKNDSEGQYPTGSVDISVHDDRYYHLHIVKKVVDFLEDTLQEVEKEKVEAKSNIFSSLKMDFELKNQQSKEKIASKHYKKDKSKNSKMLGKVEVEVEPPKNDLIVDLRTPSFIELQAAMALVAQDIVEHALETFIFDETYLFLKPNTKKKLTVYFTKIERIGCHNCYYDFELYDPETDDLVLTKTARIFAEILPHPIQINPDLLLDMSNSHIIYGFCEDQFVITNTHKLFPVTVKIKLSKRMSKLIRIIPTETLVPTTTSVPFEVKFCSRDRLNKSDDLVHFTFKITVRGHKSIYDKVPPFFFEIIAPCVDEFRKIFHQNVNEELVPLDEFTKVKPKKVNYELPKL